MFLGPPQQLVSIDGIDMKPRFRLAFRPLCSGLPLLRGAPADSSGFEILQCPAGGSDFWNNLLS